MTGDRVDTTSRRIERTLRGLVLCAAAAAFAASVALPASGQAVNLPGGPPVIGPPKLTIAPVGPPTIGPAGPVGSGIPTGPRPGVGGVGGVGGLSGLGPTTTPGGTVTPTPTNTPTPGFTPTPTPTTTTTTTTTPNLGVNPNTTVNTRLPEGQARVTPDSPYSMGANPNCGSYKSWEGFGGRPCTTRARRNVAQPVEGRGKQPPKGAVKNVAQRGPVLLAALDSVPNELIIEVEGAVTEAQAIALANRHRLTRVESQNIPLLDATMFRWRVDDGRRLETVARQLLDGGGVKGVYRNNYFRIQQAGMRPDNSGQYAVAKLLLAEAHAVTKGDEVRIAVIDSGIDVAHPELSGAIVGTYDALRSTDGPHTHGTGIAGAIASHSRLLGSAPASRLLAIRAFGVTSSGAESTSFVVLKALNYAVEQRAQIINMSFAGPKDPLLERGLAAAAKRNIILVAAAGNAGSKSPPLYPAADPNVIAVSATDAADKLFEASNRGGHVAVAAPGVDLLLPAPDEKYQVASGTSFAAAYVSGLAALIVERNPGVAPEVVKRILMDTARDLGPRGKDEQFGSGLVNAFGAVQAARPVTAGSVSRAIELPKPTR